MQIDGMQIDADTIDDVRVWEAVFAAAYVEQRFRYRGVTDEACAERAADHANHAVAELRKFKPF